MLYKLIRPPVKFALHQFFRSIRVEGAPLRTTGPTIFVANHPNMLLDPLLLAYVLPRGLYFLGKSTLFRGPVISWILNQLHMIPVYRQQDTSETAGNEDTFRFVVDSLIADRGIVIFPEGRSMGERKLSPLKTGSARMALQAEAHKDFGLGVHIQPIGITYTDPHTFQSSVTLTAAEPIDVATYADAYHQDARDAARSLTEKVETVLKEITVEVEDLAYTELVEKIGKVYQSQYGQASDKARLKLIADRVSALAPQHPEQRAVIEKRIDDYLDLASLFFMEGDEPLAQPQPLLSYLFLPLVVIGFLSHYLPYKLIGQLVPRVISHQVTTATAKLSLGITVFCVWYIVLAIAYYQITGCILYASGLLTVTFVSGLAVNRYLPQVRLDLLSSLWPGSQNPTVVITTLRDSLIGELDRFRS